MATKFKDNEIKTSKSKMIKKIVLFILSSIMLVIVAAGSMLLFNNSYRYDTKQEYFSNEYLKSEINKEIDILIPMIMAQVYKENESEFVKGINLAKEQLDNGDMKENIYKVTIKNEMLSFIDNLKIYLSEANAMKFERLLEKNKEKYDKEAEDQYKEKVEYIYEAIISFDLEDDVRESVRLERDNKLDGYKQIFKNVEIQIQDRKELFNLAEEVIKNKGKVKESENFVYTINGTNFIKSSNYENKKYDVEIYREGEYFQEIQVHSKISKYVSGIDVEIGKLNNLVEKLYGENTRISMWTTSDILFSKNFSSAYIEEAETNLIATNKVLITFVILTIVLIAIFMKFSASAVMFIHRKTPILINIGIVIGSLNILIITLGWNRYLTDMILVYTILLAIILCIEYIMIITDIAYVIDYGFKSRYAVDIWILKKINIFRFLKFNSANNIEKMKNIKSKSPEFVKGMGGKVSNLVSEIKADKDKSERVYKYATISGFIGMALATVFGGFLILVSGIPLIFILIAISIGGLIIVVYTYMYIKIEQLKYDIKGIEKATSRIVDGDFNINFENSEVRELDIIRENILSIDKGFKIAVEDELKSERMKAELITNVSHDLKTPLTSIINYVDLLQMVGVSEEDRTEYLKILDNKSKRLKVLIEDLFEASKATTGNIKLNIENIENIDIVSVLRQTFAEFKEKIDDSTLDFKINIPDHKVKLDLDGARMWRVFENLIGNALKYSMEESRVYLDLKDLEDKVVFEIKNISGYELNCDPIELKERFKRADESRTMEGSGLGLSIANGLIEAQGGELDIFIDGDLFKVVIIFEK